jgi:hypothetical protein
MGEGRDDAGAIRFTTEAMEDARSRVTGSNGPA